jgi:hypothetical protein
MKLGNKRELGRKRKTLSFPTSGQELMLNGRMEQ